jgi:hypothetical protein
MKAEIKTQVGLFALASLFFVLFAMLFVLVRDYVGEEVTLSVKNWECASFDTKGCSVWVRK